MMLPGQAGPRADGDVTVRGSVLRRLTLPVLSIGAALALAGLVLFATGSNPLRYYRVVLERAVLSPAGLQQSLTRTGPGLLLAAGLIAAFRAGVWNLGMDGQFLLGAVAAATAAPVLVEVLPWGVAMLAALALASAAAAAWSLVPALLKAYRGVNEVVTTLMTGFLGASLANLLIKEAFRDPGTTVPRTRTLAVGDRLPHLPGTTVTAGLLVGVAAVLAVHFGIKRTSFGLKLRVLGLNPRVAVHVGLPVPALTIAAFSLSAGLAGLAGGIEAVGIQGNIRADWNPGYGLLVIPAVLLARLNGFASILFVFLLAVLQSGGESAARLTGVSTDFTLVLVASLLIVFAAAELTGRNRPQQLGTSS